MVSHGQKHRSDSEVPSASTIIGLGTDGGIVQEALVRCFRQSAVSMVSHGQKHQSDSGVPSAPTIIGLGTDGGIVQGVPIRCPQ